MGFDLGRVGAGLATGGMSELFRGLTPDGVGMGAYNRAAGKATNYMNKGYDDAVAGYDPFMKGTTSAGMGMILDELGNSGTYRNLVGERGNTMKNYLSDVGLSRSGHAVNEMADLSQDTLLGLEGLLSGRQFQGAQAMSGLNTGRARDLSGILMGKASANVNAQQQEEQAKAAMLSGLIGGGAQIGSAMFGGA